MENHILSLMRKLRRSTCIALAFMMLATGITTVAAANPFLVNTESFQTIDDGDGTTNIQLQFGTTGENIQWDITDGRIEFSDDAQVQGDLDVTGTLDVTGAATFSSTVTLGGVTYTFPGADGSNGQSLTTDGAGGLSWAASANAGQGISVDGNNFFSLSSSITGTTLDFTNVNGDVFVADTSITSNGTLSVAGAVTLSSLTSCTFLSTDGSGVLSCDTTDYITELELDTEAELEAQLTDVTNIITNNDDTDDIAEGSTNLFYTEARFDASFALKDTDDLAEGLTNLFYTEERTDDRVAALFAAGTGILLAYDDTAGSLTVYADRGTKTIALTPEYSGGTYYGDGSANVGQMSLEYDATNDEGFYKWSTSKNSLQDYNIAVRVQLPDNFGGWTNAPVDFRYRTATATAGENAMTVTMLDTAGASVGLTGGANLVNTSWTTAGITGPEATGTYTPGEYITLIVQVNADSTNDGEAHSGHINLNFETNRP